MSQQARESKWALDDGSAAILSHRGNTKENILRSEWVLYHDKATPTRRLIVAEVYFWIVALL